MSFVRRFILELTVFVCGANVMIYEIIGSRIVSPFIGTSTYVWTGLIGIILASLSVGYWLGGKIADERPDIKILATIIFVAGGLVAITTLIKDVVLTAVAAAPTGLEIKSLLASALLFAPASIALGFVTPYAIRLKIDAVADSGKTVGRLYAFSTIGSIAGTFGAGFFLIPLVGSTRTLYIIAGSLFALALFLAPFALRSFNIFFLVIFAFAIAGNEATTYYMTRAVGMHDIDTQYSRAQVFELTEPETGRRMRGIATDPYFVQSLMYLDSDELATKYAHFYHLVRHLRPDFQNALIIGGAGYSFPRDYLRTYPNARLDVVEIDPGMTDIARRYFRLTDDLRLKIIHEDGRVFLNHVDGAKYNVIFMDAFGSLFSIPYHLTTREAVERISRALDDRGVVIFNVGSAISGDASGFLRAELATYRSVFPSVSVFKVRLDAPDERPQNLMVVACKSECDLSDDSTDPEITQLLSHRYEVPGERDLPILTDDLAPVEYYNSFAQNSYHR